jgi:hypothetical protein
MNGEDKVTGVDDFLRAQEDKSRDLGEQQRADQAEPGDPAPGAQAVERDQPGRD